MKSDMLMSSFIREKKHHLQSMKMESPWIYLCFRLLLKIMEIRCVGEQYSDQTST
jgi:hypothetical protein